MLWGFRLILFAMVAAAFWVAYRFRPRASNRRTKKTISRLANSLRDFHRQQRPFTPPRESPPVSPAGKSAPDAAAPPSRVRAKLRFISAGQSVLIGNLPLVSPMIYLADGPAPVDEPSAIDPAARVIGTSQQPPAPLPASPRYDELSPMQRHAYLQWLASARAAAPSDPGFALLYLYGLERRLLVDKTDARPIAEELLRLIPLLKPLAGADNDRSFTSHAMRLLTILLGRLPDAIDARKIDALLHVVPEISRDDFESLLGWMIARRHPVTASNVWPIALNLPETQKGVVVDRLPNELRALLQIRFAREFPGGLLLPDDIPEIEQKFKPANPSVPPQKLLVPDIDSLWNDPSRLGTLWKECVDDLRRLSTVAARSGSAMQLWEATPAELRAGRVHPLRPAIRALVETATDHFAVIEVSQLAKMSAIDSPKLSLAQSRDLCDAIGLCGFCIEPDANLTGRLFRRNQFVTIFPGTPLPPEPPGAGETNADQKSSPPSPTAPGYVDRAHYEAAGSVLRIALAIAAIDGIVKPAESEAILAQLHSAFDLSSAEQTRIAALHAALIREPVETLFTGQPLKKLTPNHRQSIGRLVLAVIAADGPVDAEKLIALKKTCAKLGFEKIEIDQILAPLFPKESPEKAPGPAKADSTKADSTKADSTKADSNQPVEAQPIPVLDRAAIDAIFRDTRQVAQLLADAMNEKEDEITVTGTVSPPAEIMGSLLISPPSEISSDPISRAVETGAFAASSAAPAIPAGVITLPPQYIPLYEQLITRPEWPLTEAQALARQHGLMLAGAVDAINDWSQDHRHGQLFFEEETKLIVDQSLPPPA